MIAKMMDQQDIGSAAVVHQVQAEAAHGCQIVAHVDVLIAKMMDQLAFGSAAVVAQAQAPQAQAPLEVQQELLGIGIAVVELVEENGKVLVPILVANFLGGLQSACRIMLLQEPSVIHRGRPFSRLLLLEIPSGKTALHAENVFCLLRLLAAR